MVSCLRGPFVFLRLFLLECSPSFLHLFFPTSPWFPDFGGAKVVKGADDKIPLFYFACLLPAGFPFSLILGESRVFQKNARNYLVMSS